MKILHLSTSDISGGAARAAYRLHKGLLKNDVYSTMFVRDKLTDNENVIRYKYPSGSDKVLYRVKKSQIERDFAKYRSTRPSGLEVFSNDKSPLFPGFMNQLPKADIYHLHWISGFVDLPGFFRKISKPVVWTLHDMFPFTGGCHYSNGCEKYTEFCEACPQLGSEKSNDLAYRIWKRKLDTLERFSAKILIRADSCWLAEVAKESYLFKNLDVDTIHYGIETDEFIPLDKNACRKALNIPVSDKVIVYGAPDIKNPRKGYKELAGAIGKLAGVYPNLFLLSFGAGNYSELKGVASKHIGHVDNNHLLSVIYNCADVFVIPSLQEAFGQTALEAMSCGVPVAGFDTGGIPDMIKEGITGHLAKTGDIQDLADSIRKLLVLNTERYNCMSENCRMKAVKEFALNVQAEKYLDLYRGLV